NATSLADWREPRSYDRGMSTLDPAAGGMVPNCISTPCSPDSIPGSSSCAATRHEGEHSRRLPAGHCSTNWISTIMVLSTESQEVNGTNHVSDRLTERHLADLRGSGLSDQQIAACGFHSLQGSASVREALRWKGYDGELGDCLAIP